MSLELIEINTKQKISFIMKNYGGIKLIYNL